MTRLPKEWIFPDGISSGTEIALKQALALPAPVARVLASRGFTDPRAAEAFLSADAADLESPFLMQDMDRAVERLYRAADGKEKVYLHGDRDTDGVTSAALLDSLLSHLGLERLTHVPSKEDGYGFSVGAAERGRDFGAKLAIAVDCGIRDHAGVAAAREAGMDVLVLDHHEPGETLPPAYAVVDPKRQDCPYPFKGLSACGVAFKFAQAALLVRDPFFERPVVVFDLETATLSRTAEVVEIGAVKSFRGVITDRFWSLVKPQGRIDEGARAAHGISDADVAHAPPMTEILPKFLAWAGDATLAGHNIQSFDLAILSHWAGKLLRREIRNPVIDTLLLSREHYPGVSHKLSSMTQRLGIELGRAHRADADAEAAFCLLKKIVLKRNPEVTRFLSMNLDLVALSTMADVVPLSGENRVLVSLGLGLLSKPRRPGLAALFGRVVRSKNLRAKDLSWSVIPVLNAAGRQGKSRETLRLLLTRSDEEAKEIVDRLVALNEERKAKQKVNEAKVLEHLEETFDPARDPVVVASLVGMERGVTGILANRLVRDLGRPVILLIEEGDICGGTSRGVEGLDLLEALESCRDLLLSLGGHKGAAAISLDKSNLPALRERFAAYVTAHVEPEMLVPRLRIDAEIYPDEISEELLAGLERLEPAGFGNEAPVFVLRDAEVAEAKAIGTGKRHLRLTVRRGGKTLVFLSWNYWDAPENLAPGTKIDLAFTCEPEEKQYGRGGPGLRCLLEDLHVK